MKLKTAIFFLVGIWGCVTLSYADEAWDRVQKTGELRWGGDAAGGAPYVYPDKEQPDKLIGFEIEIPAQLTIMSTPPKASAEVLKASLI